LIYLALAISMFDLVNAIVLGRDGLDQLPNQRVFSASGVSDKTVGLAMCYQLANRFARCY